MYHKIFVNDDTYFVLITRSELTISDSEKLSWLLDGKELNVQVVEGSFIGPRNEFISPFSSNAVEICRRCGMPDVVRLERFFKVENVNASYDRMLEKIYSPIEPTAFYPEKTQTDVLDVICISDFNKEKGLALSDQEVSYLEAQAKEIGRNLKDTEVYAFAQINSEHCRHKIFNASFNVDGEEKEKSLFSLIKETSKKSPENIVSAYKDNVAFYKGAKIDRFLARENENKEFHFEELAQDVVLSLKAETHNFPTTVEPFNGASTGSGGEIRDRMAGGKAGIPLAGSAVYMTAFSRLSGTDLKRWEQAIRERNWKYQSPAQILVKASNGASDFGNKFGQPLINGSLLTLEFPYGNQLYSYDRVVMLAGGVGFARLEDAFKDKASDGDLLVVLGGDNYRIGMAGGSVSSVDTGILSSNLELSAIQRANAEMQKRVCNVIRTLSESNKNPIKLIHDHGSGGHINCLTELLEETGGEIWLDELPLGDETLSPLEILCNESQERMGLVISPEDVDTVREISKREGAPFYIVGKITNSERISVISKKHALVFDLPVSTLIGNSPKFEIKDLTQKVEVLPFSFPISDEASFVSVLKEILSLEGVSCKDWLTNKVDRSVTGLVGMQQCTGPFHLPLNDCGIIALDYTGERGIVNSIGHTPGFGIMYPSLGAELSVVEAISNLACAPLEKGLKGVVLSANWMWPAKQSGEDARLYEAVSSLSQFCCELGVAVPTGKDSLSMTMRYDKDSSPRYSVVKSPGTVVVSASALTKQVYKSVSADLKPIEGSLLYSLDFGCSGSDFIMGGALSQVYTALGAENRGMVSPAKLSQAFSFVQDLLDQNLALSVHDVSYGGLFVSILEMAMVGDVGVELSLSNISSPYLAFSEKPKLLIQVDKKNSDILLSYADKYQVEMNCIGVVGGKSVRGNVSSVYVNLPLDQMRAVWTKPSFDFDKLQTNLEQAKSRYNFLTKSKLDFNSDYENYTYNINLGVKPRSAIIREKGTNGDRELAYCLYSAGFDVLDVTMDDLLESASILDNLKFLAFPGGFSNSDVLGAGKGWASAFMYNKNLRSKLDSFFEKPDTLSIGVCNGCQLMTALGLIDRVHPEGISMNHNFSSKFESIFTSVTVSDSPSILLKPISGLKLGVWVAHGEGRFSLNKKISKYHVAATYTYGDYPWNPNGSDEEAAAICSMDGRHLAIMPHIERSFKLWQWPVSHLYKNRKNYSPWMKSFIAAKAWFE